MNPELTLADIEQHGKDCMVWCDDDLIAAAQVEEARIEARMQLRFAKTFGDSLWASII